MTPEAQIAALRVAYARSLPGRVRQVARAVRDLRLDEARTLAHRLRGTAGSYGFLEVGALLGRVEDAILHAAPARGEGDARAWGEIDAALREARARVAEEIRALPRGEVGP